MNFVLWYIGFQLKAQICKNIHEFSYTRFMFSIVPLRK